MRFALDQYETHSEAVGSMTERFPLEPLARAARADSVVALARAVGVSPRTVHRWAIAGIPTLAADRAAIAVGSHPANIWPRQWNQAIPEESHASC